MAINGNVSTDPLMTSILEESESETLLTGDFFSTDMPGMEPDLDIFNFEQVTLTKEIQSAKDTINLESCQTTSFVTEPLASIESVDGFLKDLLSSDFNSHLQESFNIGDFLTETDQGSNPLATQEAHMPAKNEKSSKVVDTVDLPAVVNDVSTPTTMAASENLTESVEKMFDNLFDGILTTATCDGVKDIEGEATSPIKATGTFDGPHDQEPVDEYDYGGVTVSYRGVDIPEEANNNQTTCPCVECVKLNSKVLQDSGRLKMPLLSSGRSRSPSGQCARTSPVVSAHQLSRTNQNRGRMESKRKTSQTEATVPTKMAANTSAVRDVRASEITKSGPSGMGKWRDGGSGRRRGGEQGSRSRTLPEPSNSLRVETERKKAKTTRWNRRHQPTSIVVYLKQECEDAFVGLHVQPVNLSGLVMAIASKYHVDPYNVRRLFTQIHGNHIARLDDEIVKFMDKMAFRLRVVADDIFYDITVANGQRAKQKKTILDLLLVDAIGYSTKTK